MKVEVTELGPIKRSLKIEVSQEDVNQQFAAVYAELNRQVRIPGFRPGKAPQNLLEQRYGKDVGEDVIRRLIPTYYEKAIRQAGLVPVVVEVPPIERVKIKKDAPFSFTATVEIKPPIQLRDYKAPNPISLKMDTRTVTDEQMNKVLDTLRERQAKLDAAPAGTALADGSYAVLDVEGFLDLAPLEGATKAGILHKLGAKLTVMGLDVDEQLTGKKEGQLIEVSQPYPASHPDPKLAGKTVVFRIKVASVKQKQLAPLDDEFAKDCGPYSSLAELKDKLREEMERALKREIEDTYKDTILKRLAETHHFDVPETLVGRELAAMVRQRMDQEARMKGRQQVADPEAHAARQQEIQQLQEQFRPEAERRVKIGMILETIAEKEGLTVEQADLDAEVAKMASELRLPVEEIVKIIKAGGEDAIDELKGRIMADKSLDFVYRHAVIQK
jgi:trigger factor